MVSTERVTGFDKSNIKDSLGYSFDEDDLYNGTAIASTSEDDLEDSGIEAEEEKAIRAELDSELPGPVTLRRLSQSHQARQFNAVDSDDSDDPESKISEDANSQKKRKKNKRKASRASKELSFEDFGDLNDLDDLDDLDQFDLGPIDVTLGTDDPYLWQYLLSSEDDKRRTAAAPDDSFLVVSNDHEGANSTDDDIPLLGTGPLPGDQIAKQYDYPNSNLYDSFVFTADANDADPSGDSTDEDDGVPPERKIKKARGTKAIEVLGNNSFSARPPVLGSWRIKGDKNVGIIDGITTRTLSPPLTSVSRNTPQPAARNNKNNNNGGSNGGSNGSNNNGAAYRNSSSASSNTTNNTTNSNASSASSSQANTNGYNGIAGLNGGGVELLELTDFINTEGLSDEGGEQYEFDLVGLENGHHISPYLYRNRHSGHSAAPVTALRQRAGSANESMSAGPLKRHRDSFAGAQKKRRRRSTATRTPDDDVLQDLLGDLPLLDTT